MCVICVPHFLSIFMLSFPVEEIFNEFDIDNGTNAYFLKKLVNEETKNFKKCSDHPQDSSAPFCCQLNNDDASKEEFRQGRMLLLNEVVQLKTQFLNILKHFCRDTV